MVEIKENQFGELCIKLDVDHKLAGIAWLTPNRGKPEQYVFNLKIEEPYIGQGYGSKLLEELKKIARERKKSLVGYIDPFAHCSMTNRQLKAWYIRHGFRCFKKKGYKSTQIEYK